ncbi:MAG: prepilin-type N-terminal cleavage/methylation domain-containing protein [Planctomycetota bacterium]
MNLLSTHHERGAKAFSLIEVLISVVVLSLGVLGLGAVIPVIVGAQRDAADKTLGLAAGEAAVRALQQRADLSSYQNRNGTAFGFWDDATTGEWHPGNAGNLSQFEGNWIVPYYEDETGTISLIGAEGMAYEPLPGILPPSTTSIPPSTIFSVNQRLFPDPRSGVGVPRYVWDFVLRRVSDPAAPGGVLEALVFVQPIDLALRLPVDPTQQLTRSQLIARELMLTGVPDSPTTRRPAELSQTLVPNDEMNETPLSYPVALAENGRLTGTGRGGDGQKDSAFYGTPIAAVLADYTFNDNAPGFDRGRLRLSFQTSNDEFRTGLANPPDFDTTDGQRVLQELASQPGQVLAASNGQIFTVLRVDEELSTADVTVVEIDQPVDEAIETAPELGRIAFVPKPPVAHFVVTFRPAR